MEDPDIECTAVMPGGAGSDFSGFVTDGYARADFPIAPSELFAYDAIILSNVPRDALERPAPRLDRGLDRPARRRAVYGRRAQ